MKTFKNSIGNEVIIYLNNIDYMAFEQIKKLSEFEAYSKSKIRVMPDCHAGKGCTIGTTMTITDKVTPNLVGVDIGCGMLTVELRDTEIDLEVFDKIVNTFIPSGKSVHSKSMAKFNFDDLRCSKKVNIARAMKSIGTLGGGNHFVELNDGDDGKKYLVIHSGSRNIGNQVAKYYQDLAWSSVSEMKIIKAKLIKSLKKAGKESEINEALKRIKKPKADKELAYLKGDDFNDYMNDMSIIQKYASLNRKTMAEIILDRMGLRQVNSFETIHNYIDFDKMILRKGAVSAENGEALLIPMNMRDGSLLCVGKGNPDWNYSAPHGAGRLMSRRAAKDSLNMDEFVESMKGIHTTSVTEKTLDEAPMAYKPAQEIIDAIGDTATIIARLKPIYNFKAQD